MQLRWCLSGSDDWRLQDGNWTASEFYGAIMLAFGINVSDSKNEDKDNSSCDEDDEELDDTWAKETISWWNQCVNLVLRHLSSDCGSSQVFGTKSAAEATVC